MRRSILARLTLPLLLTVSLALASLGPLACATNPHPSSPEVDALLAADNVVAALVTFNHAIEGAADTHLITVEMAKHIRSYIRTALVTIRDTPSLSGGGGLPIALATLDQVEADTAIPLNTRKAIQSILLSTRLALEATRATH